MIFNRFLTMDLRKFICEICTENTRITCRCPKCAFECCRTCVKRYILDLPTESPKCMKCLAIWNYEFLANNTEEKFHNHIYRDHRAKILFDKEKAMLQETQQIIVDNLERVPLPKIP